MLIRPMDIVNGTDGADTDHGVGGEHRIHVGQLAENDRHSGGMLVPSLTDQSHGHAEEAVRLGPDDPVTVDESDVRRGRLGDSGVGVDEQHVAEAIALRDAPAMKGTEQPDVFDLRHIATIDSRLEAQRGRRRVRSWSGGDQDLRFRVRTGVAEFEGGVEYGHPDHHRGADVSQRVTNEVSDPVGVQVGIEYLTAIPHQAF